MITSRMTVGELLDALSDLARSDEVCVRCVADDEKGFVVWDYSHADRVDREPGRVYLVVRR